MHQADSSYGCSGFAHWAEYARECCKYERIRGAIHDMQSKSDDFKRKMAKELAFALKRDEKIEAVDVTSTRVRLRASCQFSATCRCHFGWPN